MNIPADPNALVAEQFVADYYGVSRRTIKLWRYQGRGPEYIRVASNVIRYRWGAILAHNAKRAARSTSQESAAA